MPECLFTFSCVMYCHTTVGMTKEMQEDVVCSWTMDTPNRHSTTAAHQPPSRVWRFTARAQRRCPSVASASGESETSLWAILIHADSRFTIMVASEFISSFDPQRLVHLLLIRPDRFTSASPLFPPSRALSARLVDAPCRGGRTPTAFRFLQQVDVEAGRGGTF